MPNSRRDPVSGRLIIVAENRAQRPVEYQRNPFRRLATDCPFCSGREEQTPDQSASYSLAGPIDSGPWQVRVVPNKYPAIESFNAAGICNDGAEIDLNTAADQRTIHDNVHAVMGIHEVIIESPNHLRSITELADDQLALAYKVYRDRLNYCAGSGKIAYAMIFKNGGPQAGASLEHLHSQLMGLTVVPGNIQIELDNCRRFYHKTNTCLLCALLKGELNHERRIVAQTPRFTAFCPFASRFAYEVWILPKRHSSRFEQLADSELDELAGLARETVGRLEQTLDCPSYNWLLYSEPFDRNCVDHYHWRIEVFPRLTEIAGFELGTGCFINSVPPELAAKRLHSAQI